MVTSNTLIFYFIFKNSLVFFRKPVLEAEVVVDLEVLVGEVVGDKVLVVVEA